MLAFIHNHNPMRWYYDSHFSDEETEIRRLGDERSSQGHIANEKRAEI